jgi:YHS domain-containing protein
MGIFGRRKSSNKSSKETHTDPVCGMAVVEEQAIGPDTVQGEVYWFCSAGCQDQFRERRGLRASRRDQERHRREGKQKVMP